MRPVRLLFAACAAIVAVGITNCGSNDSSSPGDGDAAVADGNHIPVSACDAAASGLPQHREAASCPTTRATGMYGATASDAGAPSNGGTGCRSDADCTEGKNGRCGNGQGIAYICTYDQCSVDSDCTGGTVCNCNPTYGNACIPANCKTDADCGTGFTCAATYDTTCGAYDGIAGYYCHSAKDDCQSTCDCSNCSWGGTEGKWICPANDATCTG